MVSGGAGISRLIFSGSGLQLIQLALERHHVDRLGHDARDLQALGAGEPARLDFDAPQSLTAALPAGAMMRGIAGVVDAILATGASLPATVSPPADEPADKAGPTP